MFSGILAPLKGPICLLGGGEEFSIIGSSRELSANQRLDSSLLAQYVMFDLSVAGRLCGIAKKGL